MKKYFLGLLMIGVSLLAHAERRWIKILDVDEPYSLSYTVGCTGGYYGPSAIQGVRIYTPLYCSKGRLAIPKKTGIIVTLGLKGPNCESDAPERYQRMLFNLLSQRQDDACLYIRPLEEKIDVMNDILVDVANGSLEIVYPIQLRKVPPRSRRPQNCISDNDMAMDPKMALPSLALCPYVVTD